MLALLSSREPGAVQPHLIKCFEAVRTLEFESEPEHAGLSVAAPRADGQEAPAPEAAATTGTAPVAASLAPAIIAVSSIERTRLRLHKFALFLLLVIACVRSFRLIN